MRLLVLGGTQFVGRHVVGKALASGHEVTLFHRGKTNPGLFPDAEELIGDRDGGLAPLRGRRWDAVIDVNGYVPRLVRDSLAILEGSTGRYVYVSTLSALADPTIPAQDERAARAEFSSVTTEEITKESYGPLKAACEAAVEERMPASHIIVRPGFIVGPWDHTGRFNYWLRRFSEGGDMLAPGDPATPVQFIDARDLAAFILRAIESGYGGIYHAVGPDAEYDWGRVFEACAKVTGRDTRLVWVGADFLANGVGPGELPMWMAGAGGLMRTDSRKAIAAGLTFRPVTDTIRDVLEWDATHGRRDVGLTREREQEILAAYRTAREVA